MNMLLILILLMLCLLIEYFAQDPPVHVDKAGEREGEGEEEQDLPADQSPR